MKRQDFDAEDIIPNFAAEVLTKKIIMLTLRLFIVLLMSAMPIIASAQENVTGKVTDMQGEPIIGASVTIKGVTGGGAVTDLDGNYSIATKQGQTLRFTYLGMKEKLVKVEKSLILNVRMEEDAVLLNEVVAVGYGTMKRSDLTGSVSSINSKAIEQSGAMTIDQAIQGRLAGVQMTVNSGTPGGGSSIQIRGLGSINSTNEPVYVVDGVIIDGATGTATDNALSGINPSDIESMEVLKDASATAIYGAQGANGVVIITTKSGKAGRAVISASAKFSVQTLVDELPMANLREFAEHNNVVQDALGNSKSAWFAHPETLGDGTNWQRAIFSNATSQNYDISVSGGKDKNTYRVSANYLNQDGIATGSGFDRLTSKVSLDSEARKWLKLGARASVSYTKQITTIDDWNLINAAVRQKPNIPVTNIDGSYGAPEEQDNNLSNPLAVASLKDKNKTRLNFSGTLFAQFTIFKWLNYRTEVSGRYGSDETHSFTPHYYFNDYNQNADAIREETMLHNSYLAWRNQLNMSFKPFKGHKLGIMLGHEMSGNHTKRLYGKRLGGNTDLTDLDAGDASQAENDGYTTDKRFMSFFSRLTYNMRNRYLLTSTLRADGSSNFAKGHKWGVFPSVALAWRVSQEKFLKDVDWLDNLKLRLGYGLTGNANVTAFAYAAMYKNMQTIWGNGNMLSRMANENLTWEKTHSFNIGLDVNLFGNRVEFIADAYYKKTNDLLMILSLPGIAGTNGTSNVSTQAPWCNVGSVSNKGFELTLNTVNIDKNDFSWRTNLTFTLNRNKVCKLNTATSYIDKTFQVEGKTQVVTRTQVGGSIGDFYGYRCLGCINSAADLYDADGNLKIALPDGLTVDKQNGVWVGDLIFDDIDGDGVITASDQTKIGSPHPDFTGGIGNTFSYKGFDLNVFFSYSVGGDIMNWLALTTNNPNERMYNVTKTAATDYAKLGLIDPNGSDDDIYNVKVVSGAPLMYRINPTDPNNNNRVSTRIIEDGSYLRLQSVSLSYRFPTRMIKRIGLTGARLTASITNLFTITGYSGYDPEVGMGSDQYTTTGQSALLNGFDKGRYPTPRTYSLGLNVEF